MPRPYLPRKCKKPYNRNPTKPQTRSDSVENDITNRRATPITGNMATPPSQNASPQLSGPSTTATHTSIANVPADDPDAPVTITRREYDFLSYYGRKPSIINLISVTKTYGLEAQLYWNQLSEDISRFAGHFLFDIVPWDKIDQDTQAMLTSWAPVAKLYLENGVLAKVILEGWVWRFLCRSIFEATGEEDARTPPWRTYGALVRFCDPTTKVVEEPTSIAEEIKHRYVLWRGLSAFFIEYSAGVAQQFSHDFRFDRDYVIQLISREFGPFLRAECSEGGKLAADYEKTLRRIVENVIKADICLQRCATTWNFDFADPITKKAYGFPFKPNGLPFAEVIKLHYINSHFDGLVQDYTPKGALVDFVVQPSLRSTGGMDVFEDYASEDSLAPMVVVVDVFPPGTEVLDLDVLIQRRSKRSGEGTVAEVEPE